MALVFTSPLACVRSRSGCSLGGIAAFLGAGHRRSTSSDQRRSQPDRRRARGAREPHRRARRGVRGALDRIDALDGRDRGLAGQGRRAAGPARRSCRASSRTIAVDKFIAGGSAGADARCSRPAAAFTEDLQRDELSRVALDQGAGDDRRDGRRSSTISTEDTAGAGGQARPSRPSCSRRSSDKRDQGEALADAVRAASTPRRRPSSAISIAAGAGASRRRRRSPRPRRASAAAGRRRPPPARPRRPPHAAAPAPAAAAPAPSPAKAATPAADRFRRRRRRQPRRRSRRRRPADAAAPTPTVSPAAVVHRAASRSTRRTASSACRTGSPPSRPAWRSTARASPSTRGARPASTCRTSRPRSTPSTPHVAEDQAQPGDLIFYYSPIGHVGIYIGGGAMIHAPRTGRRRQGLAGPLEQGRRRLPPGLTPAAADRRVDGWRSGRAMPMPPGSTRPRSATGSSDTSTARSRRSTFDLIAGGRSNLTFRVTGADGHAFVLRRPPLGHVLATAHDMAREHRIIAARRHDRRARAAGARAVHRRGGQRRAVLRDGLRRRRRARQRRAGPTRCPSSCAAGQPST